MSISDQRRRHATLGWARGVLVLLLWLGIAATTVARDSGIGQLRLVADGIEFKIFTYRPPLCAKPSALVAFHGLHRKAESVRNKAMDIATRACLMVFAPLFDQDRFPNWRYHRAGVVRDGRVQPVQQWTGPVLHALLDLTREAIGNPDAKLYLFGHSAGGQFLSRIAAYTPLARVERIVIANPSVYVAPLLDEPAPYGFDGLFSAEEADDRLRAYLASPITIYLGQEDTGDKLLVKNRAAARQGKNRLERGRAVFRMAKNLAEERGWRFRWNLVEAPGVGHSSGGMLRAAALYQALGLSPPSSDSDRPVRHELPDAGVAATP